MSSEIKAENKKHRYVTSLAGIVLESQPYVWLQQRIGVSLTLPTRLRFYAFILLFSALSVPLLHSYMTVDLSLGNLFLHAFQITLSVALMTAIVDTLISVGIGHHCWNITLPKGLVALTVGVVFVLVAMGVGVVQSVLPFTQHIITQHVVAGYSDMPLKIVPVAILVGYFALGAMRREKIPFVYRQPPDSDRTRTIDPPAAIELVPPANSSNEKLGVVVGVASAKEGRGMGQGWPSERKKHPPTLHLAGTAAVEQRFNVKHNGAELSLNPETIIRLEADENYLHILTQEKSSQQCTRYFVRITMSAALRELPSHLFIRTHRSHAVGLRYVSTLERQGRQCELRLTNGEQVPVSRNRTSEVTQRIQHISYP